MTDDLRTVNAAIGQKYDAVPYEPPFMPILEPARVLGLAALYQAVPREGISALDLGCGRGVHLERISEVLTGRIVGTDIAETACRRAAERCARFPRVSVLCRDLLELTPDDLGTFDLIYHIGVRDHCPRSVQRYATSLIGRCLAPRGVVIVGYYAGSVATQRAMIHRIVRANLPPGPPAEQMAEARRRLRALRDALPASGANREVLAAVLDRTIGRPDGVFFHEVLDPAFEPSSTHEIHAELAPFGVSFLTYLNRSSLFGAMPSPADRAFAADAADLAHGGYRLAVFGRPDRAFSVRAPEVVWHSSLTRHGPVRYDVPGEFKGDSVVPVRRPATQAVLDAMRERPAGFDALVVSAATRLGMDGLGDDVQARVERDLVAAWRNGWVYPTA